MQKSQKNIWKSANYRDKDWHYVPAEFTNIRETMDRYREYLKKQKK